MKSWRPGSILGALIVVLLMAPVASAQERFTAIVARISGAPGADLKRVSVEIERYTSEEEVRELSRILSAGGQPELLLAVQMRRLGSLVAGDGPPSPIRAARATVTPAGRRIVVATVRPTGAGSQSPPSAEYPFQVLELDIDAGGDGSGRLIEEARISISEAGVVSITSYRGLPQTLIEVKKAPPP